MPTVVQGDLHAVAAELSALLRDRPTVSTPAAECADWFDRKAEVLARVAPTDPRAVAHAKSARELAIYFRTGGSR